MKSLNIALCTLNQWCLDYKGNTKRILESIDIALQGGAQYRVGNDLEICGYNCQDHFLEEETLTRCVDCLATIIDQCPPGIICDVGLPIRYRTGVLKCKAIFTRNKLLALIACTQLQNSKEKRCNSDLIGTRCYQENRWFDEWPRGSVRSFTLPVILQKVTSQTEVPIGDLTLVVADRVPVKHVELRTSCTACDMPRSILLFTAPQYHLKGHLQQRINRITDLSCSHYACCLVNFVGCDGDRMVYDGCSACCAGGVVLAQSERFTLDEVNVLFASIDLTSSEEDNPSASLVGGEWLNLDVSEPLKSDIASQICPFNADSELCDAAALWLWDHLRRSRASGFFLPLSGGIDSASVGCIVHHMCSRVMNNSKALETIKHLAGIDSTNEHSVRDLCNRVLSTAYISTQYNSNASKERSVALASEIGSNHYCSSIDYVLSAMLKVCELALGFIPLFSSSKSETSCNVALQNLQARTRMVLSYLLAQLLPVVQKRPGFLLVLGTGNADETITGYFTKYDCSSADINPIGGVDKNSIRLMCRHLMQEYGLATMEAIINAKPSAELRPSLGQSQDDESELGLTFDDIEQMSKLHLDERCGPRSMMTATNNPPGVKMFYRRYLVNRHKVTVATPSMLCQTSSTDDCRTDFRPFTYPMLEMVD